MISNEESISQLFRDQEEKYLNELISKRNSFEERSSMLTVTIYEMKADRARHEISVIADSVEEQNLERRIAEVTDQIITLNHNLLARKSVQITSQKLFDNFEKMHLEREAKLENLKIQIDDLRDAFRQKVTQLLDNFTNYGQKRLADKYCTYFRSSLSVEGESYIKSSFNEIINGAEKLELRILRELGESKCLISDFVGEDQFRLLVDDPQQCLKKFRLDFGKGR